MTVRGHAVVVMMVGLMAPLAASAAEQTSSAPAPAAAAAVASTASASTSIEGAVASITVAAPDAQISVRSADGKTTMLSLDPSAVFVWKEGRSQPLGSLKAGDQVKVRYAMKDGKQQARSIELMPAPHPMASSGSSSAPAAKSY